MKLKIIQISVIKNGVRVNIKSEEIVSDLEKFRSKIRETHGADKILFCIEEIENN